MLNNTDIIFPDIEQVLASMFERGEPVKRPVSNLAFSYLAYCNLALSYFEPLLFGHTVIWPNQKKNDISLIQLVISVNLKVR